MLSFQRVGAWPPLPFSPDSAFTLSGQQVLATTATLAVTSSTGRVALLMNAAPAVEFYNAGNFDCAVCLGDFTVTAIFPSGNVGNYVVGAGQRLIVTIPPQIAAQITNCAAICAAGQTTTLYISPGVGAS